MGEIDTARERPGHRMEHDLLGELAVPNDAYYGVHTARALRNFAVSWIPIGHHPELVIALAAVKQAAAAANRDLGRLSALARDAQASNRPVRELAQERGLLPPGVIDALLADPHRLTGTAGPQEAIATRQPAGPPTTITGGTA